MENTIIACTGILALIIFAGLVLLSQQLTQTRRELLSSINTTHLKVLTLENTVTRMDDTIRPVEEPEEENVTFIFQPKVTLEEHFQYIAVMENKFLHRKDLRMALWWKLSMDLESLKYIKPDNNNMVIRTPDHFKRALELEQVLGSPNTQTKQS